MESGTPGKSVSDGWLNRALPAAESGASPLRAVALGNQVPRTLRGEHEVIAIGNAQQFKLGNEDTASILRNMYSLSPDAPFRRTGTDAFEAMKMLASIGVGAPDVESGGPVGPVGAGGPARYGQGGELGRSLQELARLIKADAGVEAAVCRNRRLGPSRQQENQQAPQICCASSPARDRRFHPGYVEIGWKISS